MERIAAALFKSGLYDKVLLPECFINLVILSCAKILIVALL